MLLLWYLGGRWTSGRLVLTLLILCLVLLLLRLRRLCRLFIMFSSVVRLRLLVNRISVIRR